MLPLHYYIGISWTSDRVLQVPYFIKLASQVSEETLNVLMPLKIYIQQCIIVVWVLDTVFFSLWFWVIWFSILFWWYILLNLNQIYLCFFTLWWNLQWYVIFVELNYLIYHSMSSCVFYLLSAIFCNIVKDIIIMTDLCSL